MTGAVVMVLILVVGLPVSFMVTGAVIAVVLGQSLGRCGESSGVDRP